MSFKTSIRKIAKKFVLGALFVLPALFLAQNAEAALTPGTITQCGIIDASGVYTLGNNFSYGIGDCFTIQSSDVVIDAGTNHINLRKNIDNSGGYNLYFSGGSSNGKITGSVSFNSGAVNYGNVTGNASFYDTAHNQGSIDGAASFDASIYNSLDGIPEGDPTGISDGAVVGQGVFFDTSSSSVTFTLNNNDIWAADTSSWNFVSGGSWNWVFNGNSKNTGNLYGNITLNYPSPIPLGGVYSATIWNGNLKYVGYPTILFFNNTTNDGNWSNVSNWADASGTPSLTLPAPSTDVVINGHVGDIYDNSGNPGGSATVNSITLVGGGDIRPNTLFSLNVLGSSLTLYDSSYVNLGVFSSLNSIAAFDSSTLDYNSNNYNYGATNIYCAAQAINYAGSSPYPWTSDHTNCGKTYYWYSTGNTDWYNSSNWWRDQNHQIPALNYPSGSSDSASITGSVAPVVMGGSVSINSINESLTGSATTTGITFSDGAVSASMFIGGNVTFASSSYMGAGQINGDVNIDTDYYNNGSSSAVDGVMTFSGGHYWYGKVVDGYNLYGSDHKKITSFVFNDTSANLGYIGGNTNVIFTGSSFSQQTSNLNPVGNVGGSVKITFSSLNPVFSLRNSDTWNYGCVGWIFATSSVPTWVFRDSSTLYADISAGTSSLVFRDASSLRSGNITGKNSSVMFYDHSSMANGNITDGQAIFNNNSNFAGGYISGSAIFNNNSIVSNNGVIYGQTIFNDSSLFQNGVIVGNVTFNDFSKPSDISIVNGTTTLSYVTASSGVAVDMTGYANGHTTYTIDGSGKPITTFDFVNTDNRGYVTGNAIFETGKQNLGTVSGSAKFKAATNGTGVDLLVGNVGSFTDASGTPILNWVFNNTNNDGIIIGDAIFNNGTVNNNRVVGSSTFNGDSRNNGSVSGNVTFTSNNLLFNLYNDFSNTGQMPVGVGNSYLGVANQTDFTGNGLVFNLLPSQDPNNHRPKDVYSLNFPGFWNFKFTNPFTFLFGNGQNNFADTSIGSGQNSQNLPVNAVFDNGSSNQGIISGNAKFTNSSSNDYLVNGNATFDSASWNAPITPNIHYNQPGGYGGSPNYNSTTEGTVLGTSTFLGNSWNEGSVYNANFSETSFNGGTVNNDAVFSSSTANYNFRGQQNYIQDQYGNTINSYVVGGGSVSGNADVYSPAARPIGGTVAGVTTYYGYPGFYFYGTDGDWSNASNWWTSAGVSTHPDPGINGGLPGKGDDVYVITSNITLDSTNASTVVHSIEFEDYSTNQIEITATTGAIFNSSSANDGFIVGDAKFVGDLSNLNNLNGGRVSGSVTREYDVNATTTRNFTTDGGRNDWTIIANGVALDISGATYGANNTFKALGGGSIYTGSNVNGPVTPVVTINSPVVSAQLTKWTPNIVWENLGGNDVCTYSYDNWATSHTVSCSNNGFDISKPAFGSNTLNLRETTANGKGISENSVSFTYNNTVPTYTACGVNDPLDEATRPYYYLLSTTTADCTVTVNTELRGASSTNATGFALNGNINANGQNLNLRNITVNGNITASSTIFYRDNSSMGSGTITGQIQRIYTQSATTTKDFTTEGGRNNWVITAQGGIIDISHAIYNSNNVFKALGGATFYVGSNAGGNVIPQINVTSPIVYLNNATTTTIKWAPVINWDTSTICQYAYNSTSTYHTVDCSKNGSDIPRPTNNTTQTLYTRGTTANGSLVENSFPFFYDNTKPAPTACGTDLLDEASRPYYYLTGNVTGNCTATVNTKLYGSPLTTANSKGNLGYTVNGNITATGHTLTLKDIIVTGTIDSNGIGNNANGGILNILYSTTTKITVNGNAGGSGGTINVASSTTGELHADGSKPSTQYSFRGNAGVGGVINATSTIALVSDTPATANGGTALSCGAGGNGGSVTLYASFGYLASTNAGSGAGYCGGSGYVGHSSSGGGSTSKVPASSNGNTGTGAGATSVVSRTTGSGSSSGGSNSRVFVNPNVNYEDNNLHGVNLDFTLPNNLKIKDLPVFSDTGAKGTFGFGDLISSFVFAPLPDPISVALKKAPALNDFLASAGISREQGLVSIIQKPLELPSVGSMSGSVGKSVNQPAGLFLVTVGTSTTYLKNYVSASSSTSITQLVKVDPGVQVTVFLVPTDKGSVTGTFGGKTITFQGDKSKLVSASFISPSVAGKYVLKTASSPIPLTIEITKTALSNTTKKPLSKTRGSVNDATVWGLLKPVVSFFH